MLDKMGVETELIVDSAARSVMNEVDLVVVGADVITASGTLVNKIGTAQIALFAHEARTSFMVAAETYKFSPPRRFSASWSRSRSASLERSWRTIPGTAMSE